MNSTTNRSSSVVLSAPFHDRICPRNSRLHGACLKKWNGTTKLTGKDHWYVCVMECNTAQDTLPCKRMLMYAKYMQETGRYV